MSKFKVEIANGLRDLVMATRHGGARSFARIDTAFALLQTLRAPAAEVRLADAALVPRPYRRSRPAALDRLRAEAATRPIAARPPNLESPRCPVPFTVPRRAPPPSRSARAGAPTTPSAPSASSAIGLCWWPGRRGRYAIIWWTCNGKREAPSRRSHGSIARWDNGFAEHCRLVITKLGDTAARAMRHPRNIYAELSPNLWLRDADEALSDSLVEAAKARCSRRKIAKAIANVSRSSCTSF